MGTYAYRLAELRDTLAQLPPAANDTVNQSVADCLTNYGDMRQRAMDDLVDFMAKASIGNVGTQSKWDSRIAQMLKDINTLFTQSVQDIMLPQGHQVFWRTTIEHERMFFETLLPTVTAQRLDDLIQHQDGFSQLIGPLQDSWTYLLSENQRIQDDEMCNMRDLDKMVQEIISDMESAWSKVTDNSGRVVNAMERFADTFAQKMKEVIAKIPAGEAIADYVKKQIEDEIKPDGYPDDADEPMKAGLDYVKLMTQIAGNNARSYRALLASYKDLVSKQKGSVLTMFNRTRQGINDYLTNHDMTHAQVMVEQAQVPLNNWISPLPTSGQRDDAAVFRDVVFQKIDIVWKRTVDLDNRFRTQFQGALLSPLSNETLETLTQRYMFKEQLDRINDRELEDRLDRIRGEFPEQMERVEECLNLMDCPIDDLPDEVRDFARSRYREFREFVHDRIRTQIEQLLPAMDDLKTMTKPSNLNEDFGREELASMLE